MGLRFRRRIRILPGVNLDLSRSGLSTSVGVRGAHVTVGHGKVRETAAIPGSGLFYTETQSTAGDPQNAFPATLDRVGRLLRWLFIAFAVFMVLAVAAIWV